MSKNQDVDINQSIAQMYLSNCIGPIKKLN